jgi:hypothetical protein
MAAGDGYITEAGSGANRVWTDGKKLTCESWPVADRPEGDIAAFSDNVVFLLSRSSNSEVLRVTREDGQVLPSIKWNEPLASSQTASVLAISCRKNQVAVLFHLTGANPNTANTNRTVLQVFEGLESVPKLTLDVPEEKGEGPMHGLLLAQSYPNFADSEIQQVSWNRDQVIVCPGPKGPISAVNLKDGKLAWALERPWEFSRGFIGPSVWSDEIVRFGASDYYSDKVDLARRKKFDEAFEGHIVAGPVIKTEAEEDMYGRVGTIYVAVSLATQGPYSGYTGDCVLYEIDQYDGRIRNRTVLPQMIDGRRVFPVSDGIVFGMHNNALMRLRTKGAEEGFLHLGPGSPDHIGSIDWMTQPSNELTFDHWVSYESAGDAIAVGKKSVFRANRGWFANDSDAKFMQFPIDLFDLKTGVRREAVLRIPPIVPIKRPSNGGATRSDGKAVGFGPGGIGITHIAINGDRIRFQIATEKSVSYVEFELPLGER